MDDDNILAISLSAVTFGFVLLMVGMALLGTLIGLWKRFFGGVLTITAGAISFLAMYSDPSMGFSWPIIGPILLILSGGSSLWYLMK